MKTMATIGRLAALVGLAALIGGTGSDAYSAEGKSIDNGRTRVTFQKASGVVRMEAT